LNVKRVLDSLNLDHIRTELTKHYHNEGPGRKPINPLSMLKAQLAKHLLQIPSDRRLALRLRKDRRLARACGFRRRHTPSHGLFTHFRHRLGEEAYQRIFQELTKMLIESGILIGKVLAVDSTHIVAYSGRAMDNANGRSDPDARVGRGRRSFILGYRVHIACCADSELPLAFTVAPCNENDKVYFEPLLERVRRLGVGFRHVVADSQYNSENVRNAAEWLGAEPVIPVRRDSRLKGTFKVGYDFVAKGAKRIVRLFRKRWGIERLFSRAKDWLLLDGLRVRGLAQVGIHVSLSLISMLAVAVTAVRLGVPRLVRCIKRFVE
jgi:transposase